MPDIYINTDRPVDRSIVAGINQPQREAPIGALVAGSSYDTNLYFVKNDGTYDAASGDAGASVQVAISTLGKPQSGTFTLTDGTDTTEAISYGATALEVQTALNALNGGAGAFSDQVSVEKVSDTQYAVTFDSLGAQSVLSGSTVSLYPESTPTASIAVAGTATTNAQQIIEITRQPAIYQATWTAITNGFNATLALNTTRLLQSLLIDAGMPFYIEVKLNSEVVAREVVGMELSTMPASAFSATGLATLLDTFAANPASNGSFSASTWSAALNTLTGWESYIDTTHTSGSPYAISADTDTHFQVEADTVINSQKPADVAEFYTGSPDYVITGRNGDNLDVMLYFTAVPSASNQWLDIWVDIGGAVGEIYRQTFTFPKGAGVARGILYALPSAYTLSTWEANGGKIYVRSNASFTAYGINLNLDRSHKSR